MGDAAAYVTVFRFISWGQSVKDHEPPGPPAGESWCDLAAPASRKPVKMDNLEKMFHAILVCLGFSRMAFR
jgi:hypothetical protein